MILEEQHLLKDWQKMTLEKLKDEARVALKPPKKHNKKHKDSKEMVETVPQKKDAFVTRLEATQRAEKAGLIPHGTAEQMRKDFYHDAEKALKNMMKAEEASEKAGLIPHGTAEQM